MKTLPATLISCGSGWLFAAVIFNLINFWTRPFALFSLKNAAFEIFYIVGLTGGAMLPGFVVLGLFAYFLPPRSPLWQPFAFTALGTVIGLFIIWIWWVIIAEHALRLPPFNSLGTWIFGGLSGVSAGLVFFIAAFLRRQK
jgi:hypothetical protein